MRCLIACLLISASLHAQTTCEIWQYQRNDSANKSIARIQTFNARGQLVGDKFIKYMDSLGRLPDYVYDYQFVDTVLNSWTRTSDSGDSARMTFEYNVNGQLIRQNYFLRKATEREVEKKNPGMANYIPSSPDDGKWLQTSLVNYAYDSKVLHTISDALHYRNEDMFKMEYDDQKRLAKRQAFNGTRLSWQEDYQYFENGYKYWRVYYDAEGNLRHESDPETNAYRPMYIYTVSLDKQKRVTQVRITDEKGTLWGRTVTVYNANGQTAKVVHYNSKDAPWITHEYIYK